jgi:hypothetical protein
MIILTEQDIEYEWGLWGNAKPWQCSKCKQLLASGTYAECDGTDEMRPKEDWVKHELVKASPPLSFIDFSKVIQNWFKEKNE